MSQYNICRAPFSRSQGSLFRRGESVHILYIDWTFSRGGSQDIIWRVFFYRGVAKNQLQGSVFTREVCQVILYRASLTGGMSQFIIGMSPFSQGVSQCAIGGALFSQGVSQYKVGRAPFSRQASQNVSWRASFSLGVCQKSIGELPFMEGYQLQISFSERNILYTFSFRISFSTGGGESVLYINCRVSLSKEGEESLDHLQGFLFNRGWRVFRSFAGFPFQDKVESL